MALTVEQDRNHCKNAPIHILGSFVTTSLAAFSLRFSVASFGKELWAVARPSDGDNRIRIRGNTLGMF